MLYVIYFQDKVKFSHRICCDFLFWFSSAILLSKMTSLFFNLSTSPTVNNLPINYSEKYVRAYSLKGVPLIEFRVYGGSEFESDKIEKQMAGKYFLRLFWKFSVDFTIKWFNDHNLAFIIAEKIIKNFQSCFTLFLK